MTSHNLKNIIDAVETENKTKNELEDTVIKLRNKIKQLTDKIDEHELKIKDQEEKLSQRFRDLPENIKVLKEIIVKQRQDISEKDKEVDISRELVEKYTNQLESMIVNKETEFELIDIPGVGPVLAEKLYNAGIGSIIDLMNCDIEKVSKDIPGIGIKRLKKWQEYLNNRMKKLRLKSLNG